jgi:hypothetical protein
MIAHVLAGMAALVLHKSELESVRPGVQTVALPAADPWWKPVLEVAVGGLLVVVAVGARLALAYGWIN